MDNVLVKWRRIQSIFIWRERFATGSAAGLACNECRRAQAVLALTMLRYVTWSYPTKARYTLATKSKGRSTFGRQKPPTFDKVDRVGDNVDRDKLSNSTLSPVCTDGRQSRNFMNINEDRLVRVTVACAVSNRAPTWPIASATFPCSSYSCNCLNWR